MQGAQLSVSELACRRGDRVLFAGMRFALENGQAMQVRGPNGSGKTSLIRIVAGLLRPLEGKVLRTSSIALLDERSALDPELPLARALRFWRELDGTSEQSSVTVCDRLGLGELHDVPVRYLSTGQRKRAALARLLAQEAAIWLLDEPLNGLDSEGGTMVEDLLREHCGAGGIALVASHQPLAIPGGRTVEIESFAP